MTPMIDVCFQLIIFFMLSLRLVAPEGDFNVKMPIASYSEGQAVSTAPMIPIRLRSDAAGKLVSIQMGQRPVKSFKDLRAQIREIVGAAGGPGAAAADNEVELDCDYNLHFGYVIQAITALSGYIDSQGRVVQLIEKIKFAPPRKKEG
ncbi:MAG: biopolymer transporter ExbD [Pirellulales bacterium]|nr:biopolymer transporter ExbD [Pirellulales bacterium]